MGSGIGRVLSSAFTGALRGQNAGEAELRRRTLEDEDRKTKAEIQRQAVSEALFKRGQEEATAQRKAADAPLQRRLLEAQAGQAERANQPKAATPKWLEEGYTDFKSWRDDQIAKMSDRRPKWQQDGYRSFDEWRKDQLTGKGGEPAQNERLAAAMEPRLEDAGAALDAAPQPNIAQQWMSHVPFGLGNMIASPNYQQFDNAGRQFVSGVLRPESGANINEEEIRDAMKRYVPAPGDSPALRAQKKHNRELAKQQLHSMAGRAASAGPAASPAPGAPPSSTGYTPRYKENPF